MKYMILIYNTTDATPADSLEQEMAEYYAYGAEIDKRGKTLSSEALREPEIATTVRVRNGKTSVTDGPFAESKEYVGGYYLIEAKDKAQAIEIAALCPGAKYGAVEVREVVDFSKM
jgi:hypothetical protein